MSSNEQIMKYNELRKAISKHDKATAKQLLSNNTIINVNYSTYCYSLLHLAIINFQDTEIAELLIKNKANIHPQDGCKKSPLELAVQFGRTDVVELLLANGAHVGANFDSLVYFATVAGNNEIVKKLIKYALETNSSLNPTSSICAAADNGHFNIIQSIIPYCKFNENHKYIPFQSVVKIGQNYRDCVNILLEHGFVMSPGSEKNDSLVYSAVMNGYTKIVKTFLELGIDANIKNEKNGFTLLHSACKNKHFEIAEALINYNADINATTPDVDEEDLNAGIVGKKTPLYFAVHNNDVKLTKLLFEKGASLQNSPNLCRIVSHSFHYSKEIVKLLFEYGLDINLTDDDNNTLLHVATLNVFFHSSDLSSDDQIAKLLLDKGININAENCRGETALHNAIMCGYFKIVQLLLDNNADIEHADKKGNTPLHIASQYRSKSRMVKKLLNYNAKVNVVNKSGMTPLHVACEKSTEKKIKALLDHGADVNVVDKNSRTVLHILCKRTEQWISEIIKIILQHNVNVNLRDDQGKTPLLLACHTGQSYIIQLLLENNADPNQADFNGTTPLQIAAEQARDDSNFLKLLLQYNADPFCLNQTRQTLLHIVADNNHPHVIQDLIEMNVDVNSVDIYNQTALFLAALKGHLDVVKNLLKYGTDINILYKNEKSSLFCAMQCISYRTHKIFQIIYAQGISEASRIMMIDFQRRKVNIYQNIVNALKEHVIKLKCAGLELNEQCYNLTYTPPNQDNDFPNDEGNPLIEINVFDFEAQCTTEIEQLKEEYIKNSGITFYHLLTRSIHSISKNVNNQQIIESIQSESYAEKFPLYMDMIKNRFAEGLKRSKILGTAFEHYLPHVYRELPHNCVDEVFKYFSNKELTIFIEAAESSQDFEDLIQSTDQNLINEVEVSSSNGNKKQKH